MSSFCIQKNALTKRQTEDRRQKTEDRRQKTEDRRQKACHTGLTKRNRPSITGRPISSMHRVCPMALHTKMQHDSM
ncbi:hypothetical protein GBN24_00980 [Plesiomonas shigelloides]|nr:hypothetical protein GBN24_00980 [Plesiomonas shigelloides]